MPLGIGSITKTYVASVVLDLVGEGVLQHWLHPPRSIDRGSNRGHRDRNIRTRILEQLGLSNTEMDPAVAVPNMAHGWYDLDGDGTDDDLSGTPRVSLYSAAGAVGGIVATPSPRTTTAWVPSDS